MELSPIKMRMYEGTLLSHSGVLIETAGSDGMVDDETTYWGVLCRSCAQLVAFDVCPNRPFQGASNANPCTIRCGYGHNHIYYSRDFQFFFSDLPIDDAVMEWNREAYKAANRPPQASFNSPRVPETIKRKYSWFAFIKDLLKEAIAVRLAPLTPGGRPYRKMG